MNLLPELEHLLLLLLDKLEHHLVDSL